ncbi:chemotaxis protein [Pseudomonas cichorii]|uniref:Chemotaxis protein n=1 Tax=Pseudomonas lijiangensis TaxID=2995658 RepID=A0ABX8HVL9_9PSED|nr:MULTISPECIES: chemotaxis protein [Pseudomonas syringae group]MBX8500553.1 chemotaxis protein [Pseudomonas lijiangensis]MBX8504989.1 chemotaxis protein [Pseudomonas lijiangensis]MBX8512372.1 chemotaxis protein [Pseudomonas cichorii]MBX8527331.1 chemotaxis protein [Pseudomonas cichorii]MBX8536311.1 chemotaxis protein [Pseudomonas cichorii]
MSLSGPIIGSINIHTPAVPTPVAPVQSDTVVPVKETKGIEVNLSSAGKAAASSSSKNSDIEQSGLPESVQKILKAIRELQKKIAETMEKIQEVLNDKTLSYDERQTRATALQTVLGMLQRQVSNSTADMATLMNQLQASDADKVKAGILVMAKM